LANTTFLTSYIAIRVQLFNSAFPHLTRNFAWLTP